MAKGKYFTSIASDDIQLLDRAERQVAFMEANPHVDMVEQTSLGQCGHVPLRPADTLSGCHIERIDDDVGVARGGGAGHRDYHCVTASWQVRGRKYRL
jgi:hypothetical protein